MQTNHTTHITLLQVREGIITMKVIDATTANKINFYFPFTWELLESFVYLFFFLLIAWHAFILVLLHLRSL